MHPLSPSDRAIFVVSWIQVVDTGAEGADIKALCIDSTEGDYRHVSRVGDLTDGTLLSTS